MGDYVMILVRGMPYQTSIDAAKQLGVSTKTLRHYIHKGIIPQPPIVNYGIRKLAYFPPEYIEQAKTALADYQI